MTGASRARTPGDTGLELAVLAVVLLALGCSAAPAYHYQPPVPVTAADREACHREADAVARERYERYVGTVELAGPFGGPFGGIGLARRAWNEREAVYAHEMADCLEARGYAVEPPPAPSER